MAQSLALILELLGGSHRGLSAQASFHGCPPAGDARSTAVETLNVLKNREALPTPDDLDSSATLATFLVRGDDQQRSDDHRAATIVGYVSHVTPGSVESVNCHAKDLVDRDTHIALIIDPLHDNRPERMIVEVTPRLRARKAAQGEDWSTPTLQRNLPGRRVRVTGWLLFDWEHAHQSENTAPGRPNNWRATAWELHPVTAIEVLSALR